MATVEEDQVLNHNGDIPDDQGGDDEDEEEDEEEEEGKEEETQPKPAGDKTTETPQASGSLDVPGAANGDLTHLGSSSTFSETSFYSAKSKSDSESSDRQSNKTEMTDPTTEEGEEEALDIVSLDTVPNLNGGGRGAALALHRNESQTTIRREGSSGSDASKKASNVTNSSSKAASATLPTHHEAPSSPEQDSLDANNATMQGSQPLEKRNSQSSSRGGHHRTPSRTKRSSSGGLSEHILPILDFRPTDYVCLLEQSTPAMFSTTTEQNILHQLSGLGMDVGQIVHSVVNEACDASGAMWWILKKKAEERQKDLEAYYSPVLGNISITSPPPPLPPKDPSRNQDSSSPIPTLPMTFSTPNKNLIKPSAVYPSNLSLGLHHGLQRTSSPTKESSFSKATDSSTKSVESPSQTTPSKPVRPVERHRTSSFSVRLSNVLAGKDKDGKKDGVDSILIGDEQLVFAERSKSPVGSLLTKMSGGNNSISTPKSEKEKKKDNSKSPLRKETIKVKDSGEKGMERTSISSQSSPMRSPDEQLGRMQQSKSMDTFSTVSSNPHGELGEGSPAKGKAKPSFLSTVRTWFEDKDKGGTTRRKKQQQQQHQHRSAKTPIVPVSHAGHGSYAHSMSRNGSMRRTSASVPYPPSSMHGNTSRRSPKQTMTHRGSLSRRSSSGSNHYPHSNMASPRPKNARRQSAGSITPTATMNGEELAYALQYYHRGSRPSSAQSAHRPLLPGGGLHGKRGSASSTNSILRHQQNSSTSGYSGSLRGAHGRRASADGGTTVRRHRHYPGTHHHQHRSESRSQSRPSTPSKLGTHSVTDEDGVVLDIGTPRRSIDSEGNRGRASPLHTPRASSQSVFVAHKSRTPYKPPSSNPLLHRQDRDSADRNHRDKSSINSKPHLATWRRSWGKPPACWMGPVDHQPIATQSTVKADKPKLRDVFANKDLEDDWEDEEEEPMYAGGLGQLDSIAAAQSWSNRANGKEWDQFPRQQNQQQDGMPGHLFGSNRYAGVRSIFQPPSLGRETTPRAWTMEGEDTGAVEDNKAVKDTGGAVKDATPVVATASGVNGSSRVRAPAPAFKGADILEEDEEEEE